ncbi:hypothetical protein [Streptomyces sp. RerS4]|uniref:hypothetical protein n=1 Tax=Streptomyces sp. RerS4 TaxID=2942449 RepID=UPI00201BB8F0|nr:hypothetical protein [Streptomyces sp. RerS4]UQW99112.1 hypothetical protein M4D82_00075 [Streptomyces sp. RerS4]
MTTHTLQRTRRIPIERRRGVVATLGPEGTDAHAEALRLFDQAVLAPTFDAALRYAYENDTFALVAAGFVERAGEAVRDLWVDMHFRNLGRMRVDEVWVSPTKDMCVATRSHGSPETARSLALHPATRVFADTFVPGARRRYVDAKPVAVRLVAQGKADCCIGSVDVVERHGLRIHEVFRPTMVWCLYRRLQDREEPERTVTKRC